MTNEITITTVKESEAQALTIIEQNELSSDEAISLKNALTPFFEQAEEWVTMAKNLRVTDETQIKEMTEARKARLALKEIRVNLDKKRKELKEESLRKGKAIDGMANVLKFLIEPIEEYLEKQEKFVEIRETERKDKLEAERKETLLALDVDTAFYNLKEMPQDTFDNLVKTATEAKRLKEEAYKRAEEDRIEKEKKEADEREAQRIENARLKAEKEEQDKAIAKEREESEKKLKAEREAKEKLEKEKRDREEKERKEREKKEREEKAEAKRLAKMGDEDKVKALGETFKAIVLPQVKSDDAQNLIDEIESAIADIIKKISNY